MSRKIKCVFGTWSDDEPYKEVTKTITIADRSTKSYWDATTQGKALWDYGMKQKVKLMPVRIISVK